MDIRFDGKTAFVTGAADGIGWAAARMFAESGASVALADLSATVEKRAEELRKAGSRAIGLQCDVANEQSVKQAVESTVQEFGRLDAAYNNAGIHASVRKDLEETEGADFDRVIAVNLRGIWNCMKHELSVMKRQGSGSIVNCSSQGGLVGIAEISAYTASKHGILGLTKTAALNTQGRASALTRFVPEPAKHRW